MEIRRASLYFDHLMTYSMEGKKEDWQEGFAVLEELELEQRVYKNGPVFFTFKSHDTGDTGEFTYYLPINEEVEMAGDSDIQYQEKVDVPDALLLRQADQYQDFNQAYASIKNYSSENGVDVEDTFYCVLLEVYDDIILDLYVPVAGSGDSHGV
ncbi:hypothetical protein FZC84_19350 [Rossellomorea vietnamensis]|uniref:Integron-associated effector binding protein domain-containing protein n=1 Tax=Rossellomorea vietnamensis TaxID=218284 RepID=A0A5D4M8T6_9BACI|nr:DUF5085 family protein [Rossellomorea vietnamensis]TYR97390.1 hypothetical protein FZC84_19350 [Rossellomorea vietnamensis]